MRHIITDNIVDPVKFPVSKRTIDHWNAMSKEPIDFLFRALDNYTTNDVVILQGCVVSGSVPGTAAYTAGAIYYNGEIFQVDAASGISVASTLVWQLYDEDIPGEPTTFSDGSTHYVQEIKKARMVAGATGSGIADYNASSVKRFSLFTVAGGTITITSGSFTVNGSSNVNYYRNGNELKIEGIINLTSNTSQTVALAALITANSSQNIAKANAGTIGFIGFGVPAQFIISSTAGLTIDSSGRVLVGSDSASYTNGQSVIIQFVITTYC